APIRCPRLPKRRTRPAHVGLPKLGPTHRKIVDQQLRIARCARNAPAKLKGSSARSRLPILSGQRPGAEGRPVREHAGSDPVKMPAFGVGTSALTDRARILRDGTLSN